MRPWLLVAALSWLPLLVLVQASAAQSGQPSPTFSLCRLDVSPCQQEINLAPGAEVTLGLYISMPESARILPVHATVAWHFRLKVEGEDAVAFPQVAATGAPILEQDQLQSLLAGLKLLNSNAGTDPNTGSYYRVKNQYSEQGRRLEYAITIVSNQTGRQAQTGIMPGTGGGILLGTLPLRGSNAGTARFSVDPSEPDASRLVTLSPTGELKAVELAAREPLTLINVGPNAEKVRLAGQVWSDVPAGQGSHKPFTRPFRIEFWETESTPSWQGGSGLPLVTFTNLRANADGSFTLRDLPAELIPEGTYHLRTTGRGTLSSLKENVRIDNLNRQPGDSLQVIRVSLGPLRSGDVNGDNVIDDLDLSELASGFGREPNKAETGAFADFNDDGVIDGQDFSLMAASHGQRGE